MPKVQIPKEVKSHIRQAAKHYAKAVEHDIAIREWLHNEGCLNDTFLDQLIDRIEMGQGDAKGFIDYLESNM